PENRRVIGIAPGSPKPKILIVDDVASNRSVLRVLLENTGFFVNEASNGQDALLVINEWMPDAIFMDRYMPSLDGIETSRMIRASEKYGNIPILMLSASAITENRDEAIIAGIDIFLRKPFIEEEVFENLKKLLGVKYIYEEIQSKDTAGSSDEIITREIASLPVEIKDEIVDNANLCDVTRLRKIISSDPVKSCPGLVSRIETFLDNYEYKRIILLLNGGKAENEKNN
ncbi:MAG TPA: response regulator, partial [Candidatus Wallbacteria bacterium]|nr:response regulator [Candidatus Wallbacteria bacterium]